MEWVSFDEIKKSVTLLMVIDRYGLKLRTAGPTRSGRCPLPTHTSDKSKESFVAALDKGMGGAWVCQSKSCVEARGGKKGGNAARPGGGDGGLLDPRRSAKLQHWFSVPATAGIQEPGQGSRASETAAVQEPQRPAQLASKEKQGESEGLNKPLGFALKSVDASHPYITERGITPETAETFGVGFFPGKGSMAGRIVVPIHNGAGECVAYAGRSIDGSEPRYKFPAGFRKSLELFNLHRVKGRVFRRAGRRVLRLHACEPSGLSLRRPHGLRDEPGAAGPPCGALRPGDPHVGRGRRRQGGGGRYRERLQRVVYLVKTVELADGVQPDQLSSEEMQTFCAPSSDGAFLKILSTGQKRNGLGVRLSCPHLCPSPS